MALTGSHMRTSRLHMPGIRVLKKPNLMISQNNCVTWSALIFCIFLCVPAFGADWPMWRHDANRSAASPEELPENLHLQWVRKYSALKPAWPLAEYPWGKRSLFDGAYAPVVTGKTLVFGSSHNDSVTALDTETGAEQWRFYAEGPVRLSPVAWKEKLFFVSDDGCLYCLDARSGALLWKFRGGPADRKVLGNGRLISSWPARGGPVTKEGTIYFAASIWPFMGIFIHALDCETGKPIWTNDGNGPLYIGQPHGGGSFNALAPQGYLAASGDSLLAPNGRAVPACFDVASGELRYYRLPDNKGTGSVHVAVMDDYFFNDANIFDFKSGDRVKHLGWGRGLFKPSWWGPILTKDVFYTQNGPMVQAYDFDTVKSIIASRTARGRNESWSTYLPLPKLWEFDASATMKIKAGSRLYGTGFDKDRHGRDKTGKRVVAMDLPSNGREANVSWTYDLDGTPAVIVAADKKLFVTTQEGGIYCFGGEQVETRTFSAAHDKQAREDKWTSMAADILRTSGQTEGYCISLGLVSGRLVEELARQSQLHVIAVDPDREKVNSIRRRLDDCGLLGCRVAVHLGDPLDFAFPPYLANLIVAEDAASLEMAKGPAFVKEIFHPLRPYGGMACFDVSPAWGREFSGWVKHAKVAQSEVKRAGKFTLLIRKGALPGSADWTHEYGGPANTGISHDMLVKAPLGLLWFGGPTPDDIMSHHEVGPTAQVVGGRLFIQGRDLIQARDVYTGRVLWNAQFEGIGKLYKAGPGIIGPGAAAIGSNYAVVHDGMYLARGNECLRLDTATGKTVSKFSLPYENESGTSPEWGYVAVYNDILIGGARPLLSERTQRWGSEKTFHWDHTCNTRLVAMNRHDGTLLWVRHAEQAFYNNSVCIGGGKVFAIDRLPEAVLALRKRNAQSTTGSATLLALDARTGNVLWSISTDIAGTWLGYSEQHEILLEAGRPWHWARFEPNRGMAAYSGKDGRLIWKMDEQYNGPCLIQGDTVIAQTIAYDLLTGKPKQRIHPITGRSVDWTFTRNFGCSAIVGSDLLLTFRSGAAGYYDLAHDGGTGNLGGFRPSCTPSQIPANGVLNAPQYAGCTCSYQNKSSLALIHDPKVEMWTFNDFAWDKTKVRRVGINFGAPGDRKAANGTLWLDYPSIGGPSPDLPIKATGDNVKWFRVHSSRVRGGDIPWVYASGAIGLNAVRITLTPTADEQHTYNIRLYFCEPEMARPGERVFDVQVQNVTLLKCFDIVKESGGIFRPIVKAFDNIEIKGTLDIELIAATSVPVISGIEVVEGNGNE